MPVCQTGPLQQDTGQFHDGVSLAKCSEDRFVQGIPTLWHQNGFKKSCFSIIPTRRCRRTSGAAAYPQKLRHRIHSQLLVAMPLQACRLMLGHWWSFWCCETATRAFLLQKLATSANSNLHPFRPPWTRLTLKCSYFSWFKGWIL